MNVTTKNGGHLGSDGGSQFVMKHRMKNGFEKFSKRTSMHGFTELYTAKSSVWKFAWLLIIGAAMGITTYQVMKAIDQFLNKSTITVIENAKPEEVFYPPLKLCLVHWIDWVDTERMRHYGFSREAVLYGLSFLTTIYSNSSLDTQGAVRNFTDGMRINNLTTISDFYKKISHPVDDILFMKHAAYYDTDSFTDNLIMASEVFKEVEIIFSESQSFFCYKANGEDIATFLNRLKVGGNSSSASGSDETRNILEFDLNDEVTSRLQLTLEEYNSYMAEWIAKTLPEYGTNEDTFTYFTCENPYACAALDYSAVKPPKILYVDGFGDVGINISPETDKYYVGVRGSAHVWKSSPKNPCVPNTRFMVSNSTCPRWCKGKATKVYPVGSSDDGDCLSIRDSSVVLGRMDQPERLCQKKLYILSQSETSAEPWIPLSVDRRGAEEAQTTSVFNQTEYEERMKKKVGTEEHKKEMAATLDKINFYNLQRQHAEELRKRCVDIECNSGCEKWSYDVSVRTKSMFSTVRTVATKTYTGIQIEYPLDGDILMMREVDSQTFEGFVGNVGGLLGIWTGASILSFIQLVYLCCCSESSGGALVNAVVKKRRRVPSPKQALQNHAMKF